MTGTASARSTSARERPRASLGRSSLGLVAGRGAQSLSGLAFWVVAARLASPREVGLTVTATSAIMLSTQLAVVGSGSAVISAVGRGRDAKAVLDTALTLAGVASLATAAGYLMLAGRPEGSSYVAVVAIVVAVVAGTLVLLMDQAHVALGRGETAAMRYVVGGIVTVGAVLALGWSRQPTAATLIACWALESVVATLIGAVQLRRFNRYRYHPTWHLGQWWAMLGVGLPNQVLTVTERAPGFLLPILVAQVISPEAAAYWYPAWMMAWAVYMAPSLVGVVQFSEVVRQPEQVRHVVLAGLRWSCGLAVVVTGVFVLAATPLLGLLGRAYAGQSAGALRLLCIGLFGYAVVQAYNAVCRAHGRLTEAIVFGAALGAVACTATVLVAGHGFAWMALTWSLAMAVGAVLAGTRLIVITRRA